MRRAISVLGGAPLALVWLALGPGCQCSGGGDAGPDGGLPDASSDSDGDTDTGTGTAADSDSDGDTDTDTGTSTDTGEDPCPGEEIDAGLDGSVDWEPIPFEADCGVGCYQLSGTGHAGAYDVFGGWVIVEENPPGPGIQITLIDVANSLAAFIDLGTVTIDATTYEPAVHEANYFYVAYQEYHHYDYIIGDGSQKRRHLLEPCKGSLYEMDAWGEHIIYEFRPSGSLAGSQDLWVLDRTTGERKQVTDCGGIIQPTLSGDWATFTVLGGNVEIWAYNVISEELINASDHSSDQFNSKNDGPRVVWTDLRNNPEGEYGSDYAEADIYLYDIETEELTQITSGNGIQLYPDIQGDWIVWQDYRECPDPNNPWYVTCMRIWGYNLATEQEVKISQVPSEHARVWGDRVYFFSLYGSMDWAGVFMQDLTQLPDAGPDGGD